MLALSRSLKRCLARCTFHETVQPQPEPENSFATNRHARITRKILSRNKLDGEPQTNHSVRRAIRAPS
jgi:hypothetical protein